VPRHVNANIAASVAQQVQQLEGITSDPAAQFNNRHVALEADMFAICLDVGFADLLQRLGTRSSQIDEMHRNLVTFELEERDLGRHQNGASSLDLDVNVAPALR